MNYSFAGWAVAIACTYLMIGCSSAPQGSGGGQGQAPATSGQLPSEAPVFDEVAQQAGLDFQHFNGMTGSYFLPEIMGSGGALLDFDRDGDLDLYLVQGQILGEGHSLEQALVPYLGPLPLRDRLFRNDSSDGSLKFTDVTDISGIKATGYGMGAAVGDYNRDGFPDLYVSNLGSNYLFSNNGDGTFSEVAALVGADDPGFTVSLAFTDIDGDGFDDLFLGNYTIYDTRRDQGCFARVRDYCHPSVYAAAPDRFLRNRGNGTFEDISESSGISASYGRGLGVVVADFDQNGLTDIYVANDTTANQFWLHQPGNSWRETGLLAGCALNELGRAEASMGVAVADYDLDGDLDLFMTHNRNETNTLYVNDGQGFFSDMTVAAGLGAPSLPFAGFGVGFLDYDNDGFLDLFIANGTVTSLAQGARDPDPFPYHQTNQLFHHDGHSGYRDVSSTAGPAMSLSEVSRGALFGDLDNDGDMDIVVTNNSGPVQILRNQIGNKNPWLGLRLLDERGLDVSGALVWLERETGPALLRRSHREGSYASASDPRILIGLGGSAPIKRIKIRWPDGFMESFPPLAPGNWYSLARGSGKEISE